MFTKSVIAAFTMVVASVGELNAQSVPPRFTSVTAGSAHFCAIDTERAIYCWGDNQWGQLGNHTTVSSPLVPIRITSLQGFRQVVAGSTHTCALTVDGYPYCWGSDPAGVMGGAAGRDTCTGLPCSTEPMPAAIGRRFDSLTAGFEHMCGLTAGAVSCWGRGDAGQLAPRANDPQHAADALHFTAASARGDHTCALASGEAWCWGANDRGELGEPATEHGSATIKASPSKFTQLATAAFYTCGVTTAGNVECWGANDVAQLGAENLRATRATVQSPDGGRFTRVSVGGLHTCAVAESGRVYCWGSDAQKRLGGEPTGTCNGQLCSAMPVVVTLPAKVTEIAVGGSMACAVGETGTIYCWGGAASARMPITVAVHP